MTTRTGHPRSRNRPAARIAATRAPLRIALAATLVWTACSGTEQEAAEPSTDGPSAETADSTHVRNSERLDERRRMIEHIESVYGFRDAEVLAALERVPRHRFVPEGYRVSAYGDHAMPIGYGQTISQPYIVASMTAAAHVDRDDKVLEIGTGSGYQAAVLAELVDEVFSIEIVEPLGRQAAQVLDELGYDDVRVRIGDGYRGWAEEAPFDAILVTAAPEHVPQPLLDQLAVGGRMVLPLGGWLQELIVITRTEDGFDEQRLMGVRFVPMTGEAQVDER